MRVSLLPLSLTLALVSGADKSLADGFDPIVRSLWQEKAEVCGKAAQITRHLGIPLTGHEATMLMAAREDGADRGDLSLLSSSYSIGEMVAMNEGYHGRRTASGKTPEADAKLKKLKEIANWLMHFCATSATASSGQEQPFDQSMKERERVLAIQNALAVAGYDPGPADGVSGLKTRAAIKAYQRVYHLRADGIASEKLLDHLRKRNSSQ